MQGKFSLTKKSKKKIFFFLHFNAEFGDLYEAGFLCLSITQKFTPVHTFQLLAIIIWSSKIITTPSHLNSVELIICNWIIIVSYSRQIIKNIIPIVVHCATFQVTALYWPYCIEYKTVYNSLQWNIEIKLFSIAFNTIHCNQIHWNISLIWFDVVHWGQHCLPALKAQNASITRPNTF